MKLLGIELSSAVGSVALLSGGEILEQSIATPREQTARTLTCIDELLAAAGLALRDLDGVTFGRGPGSFTGLRMAAAHAQGLALATGLPLYPVSSLLALAQGAWRTTGIERALVCVDARMDEIYCGAFALADAGAGAGAGPAAAAADVGAGADAAAAAAAGAVRDGVMAPVAEEVIGSAVEVARLAESMLAAAAPSHALPGKGANEAITQGVSGPGTLGAQYWTAVGDGFTSVHGASALAPVAARAAQQLFDFTPAARDLFPQALRDHAAGRVTAPNAALPAYLREATAWRRY